MAKILIIDDEEPLRDVFSEFLKMINHEPITAANGMEGLKIFTEQKPDLVLTDLNMPDVNGLDIIREVASKNPDIPVIVISGVHDIREMMSAIHLGAWDYLVKPVEDLQIIEHSISRSLERAKLLENNRKYNENLETAVKMRTEAYEKELQMRTAAESLLKQSLENLNKVTDQVIHTISYICDIRDPYTGGHQHRVAQLAKMIAEKMSGDESFIHGIYIGGLLHDVGKIYIPLEILSKPGSITEIEREMIKIHTTVGHDILKGIEFPWPVPEMVLQHHERLDGSGYPAGLKGDQILLESKIISVADVVESIASHRPYRPSLGMEAAVNEIKQGIGTSYDSEVVRVCLQIIAEGFSFDTIK